MTPYGQKALTEIWADKIDKDLERKTQIPKKKHKIEKIDKVSNVSKYTLIVHTTRECSIHKKKPELFEIDLGGNVTDSLKYAKEKLGKEISIKTCSRQAKS